MVAPPVRFSVVTARRSSARKCLENPVLEMSLCDLLCCDTPPLKNHNSPFRLIEYTALAPIDAIQAGAVS